MTRKLSHGSSCLQRPYFITQHRSLGGNQAYLAGATPPKQLLLPSFLLCLAMGKMNHSTYQLNAYTSDWGGGHGAEGGLCVRTRHGRQAHTGRLCLHSSGREGRPGIRWPLVSHRLPFPIPLAWRHQHICGGGGSRRSGRRYRDNHKHVSQPPPKRKKKRQPACIVICIHIGKRRIDARVKKGRWGFMTCAQLSCQTLWSIGQTSLVRL